MNYPLGKMRYNTPMTMHWIQKHIMQELSTHIGRRYSELKPDSVDGNLFMYHMKQLQSGGYVGKQEGVYVLSEKGKIFAGRMSLSRGKEQVQPKILVMLVCQNDKGEYLLYQWNRQPYIGLTSFPFSKHRFGDPLTQTLTDTLAYKGGLSGDFAYLGDVYLITKNADGEVSDHTLVHIYKVTNSEVVPVVSDTKIGTYFWGKPTDVAVDSRTLGFVEIFELVESGAEGFMKEIALPVSKG